MICVLSLVWGNDRTTVVILAVAACMPTSLHESGAKPKFDCQVLVVPEKFSRKIDTVWYMSGPKDLDDGKVIV